MKKIAFIRINKNFNPTKTAAGAQTLSIRPSRTGRLKSFLCTAVVIFTTLLQPNIIKSTPVFAEEFYTGCDPGYYINPDTGRCNKIKVCNLGFEYDAATNSCYKKICPYGSKISEEDGKCHLVTCNDDLIYNSDTGLCVKKPSKSFEPCSPGFSYSSKSKACVENPEADPDALKFKDCTFLPDTLDFLGVSDSPGSSSSYSSDLADITAPEYDELREIISAYLEEQAELDAAEDAESTSSDAPQDEYNENPDDEPTENAKTPSCPEGKVYNPFTGRCRTAVTITETSTAITTTTFDPETGETTTERVCKDGYYLNEETGRCNKTPSSSASSPKTCPSGQYLNPATNRCKNLSSTSVTSTSTTVTTFDPLTGETTVVKTCIDGYELNPDTNRCVKVKNNTGSDFAVDVPDLGTIESSPRNFIAIATVIVVAAIGLVAVIIQFRHEIAQFFQKIALKFQKK